MRSPYLPGTMILALALAASRGAAQVEEPLHSVAVEKDRLEKTADPKQPSGRTSAPPPARNEGKDRRRPAVPLESPEDIEEPEAEGLSLDDALRRLLAANRDLAVKYQDIPKARADTLSAGLIENPAVFLESDGVPYGHYSPRRPGETGYGVTVVPPPLDLSGKRQKRLGVARRAEKVLEAVFQDAVRQEIDRLSSAFIDVLEAELRRNMLRRAATRLNQTAEPAEVSARRAGAEIALRDAEANLLQARRELALLLAVPAPQADHLAVRGSLRDRAPPPPCTDELVRLALQTRPDLAAFELSVDRARANVRLSRAEGWEDVLVFYTPYQATTFPNQGVQSAAGWEVGGLTVLPAFDRNQGDVARARANVTQLQIQLQGVRDQVIYEVQHAATEYAVSRQLVQKYESEILPGARGLTAEQDEVAEHYLEALVNHRRSMLRLNTVVGQRILP